MLGRTALEDTCIRYVVESDRNNMYEMRFYNIEDVEANELAELWSKEPQGAKEALQQRSGSRSKSKSKTEKKKAIEPVQELFQFLDTR